MTANFKITFKNETGGLLEYTFIGIKNIELVQNVIELEDVDGVVWGIPVHNILMYSASPVVHDKSNEESVS